MSTAKPLKPTAGNVNRVLREAGIQARSTYASGLRARKRYDDVVVLAYHLPLGGVRLNDNDIDRLFDKATPVLTARGLTVTRVDDRTAVISASL